MLAWIRSPRGSTATATVVAVILALYWLAPWQKPLPPALRLPFAASTPTGPAPAPAPAVANAPAGPLGSEGSTSASAPGSPAAAASAPPMGAAPATTDGTAGKGSAGTPAPAAPAKDAEMAPAFDVVRVEPTGEAVIAGRAAPGSDVALMDGDTVIAHVQADATGQFAFVPPALTSGSHDLSLRTQRTGQAPVRSAQAVAIAVAPNGATKPLVALLSPDKPAEVLSDGAAPPTSLPGAAAGSKPTAPGAAGTAAPVAIQSVQAGQNGNFLAAGVAHPGSQCRVYLNGAYLADVTAGQDGKWSVEIKKGMQPGRYTVRADELDPAGAVSHRTEVPFEYPATVAVGKPAGGAKRLLLTRKAPDAKTGAPAPGPLASAKVAAGAAFPAGSSVPMTPSLPGGSPAAAPLAAGQAAPPAASSTAAGSAARPEGPATAAPTTVADAAPPLANGALPATPASPAAAVIPDLHTTTVIRGDSLWRISRKMLGHGIQYTEIYASNTNQIRDPALIYPGQIFVVPSKRPNG